VDKAKIQKHLDLANKHVKKGEKLIKEQEERVEELARDRDPTKIHEENLEAMRALEETLKQTRDSIREELEEKKSGEI
jgi:enoyl-CoA hydratase/carnithine racemase